MVIEADSYALERIFLNILSNSVKFTAEGGSILVKSMFADKNVVIEIIDSGIGISKEALPHIFDRFHQVDASSTRKYHGSGIGLALVKELIGKMHGQISVESEPDIGTSMRVTFPLSESQFSWYEIVEMPTKSDLIETLSRDAELVLPIVSPNEQTDIETFKSDVPCVLVVDDEPDMRRFLSNSLEDSYNVILARDGKQGLEMARKYLPDLMLLDLMLPEIDGLEVCKRLKENPDTCKIKIMLLTARTDETSKITALKHGADDFLTKPFSQLEVQTRLRNLYQTAALETDLRQQNQTLEKTLEKLQNTQANLIQSEKLNALGTLAAGLLHEVNNPLNYTLMALQSVQIDPELKENDELQETFADIDEGMQRIKTIVTDLHMFAHPSANDKQITFSFNAALDSALRFTSHENKDFVIKREINGDDNVTGSQSHIVQVLINLISNACKANEGLNGNRKGEICIQAERNQEKLHIRFRDNGTGMSEEVLAHIFDPFYTTRDVGKGMGLGLSISHTIIENHGSNLTVRSEQNEWTEFSFELPLAN